MEDWEKGKTSKIAMAKAKANTPPSLLGIERRIAYANRKYHSGWMWTGVTSGFAGIKLSVSPNRKGAVKHKIIKIQSITINPNISLNE